jgi:hypothetical protein
MLQILGAWDGRQLPPARSNGVPRAVFLVSPEGFHLAAQSASDNAYMDLDLQVDTDRAMRQFQGLQRALSQQGIAVLSFAGRAHTPDAVFPNNVFATAAGRLLIGAMRHPVRQSETSHPDIRRVLGDGFGYVPHELQAPGIVAELTGSMVIDRARAIGFCGLSERCNEAGAAAMHHAFGLRGTLQFELATGEYHTNVVLSALAGRALVMCPDGIAQSASAARLRQLYPHCIELSSAERQAYAGNCIALTRSQVWMSERAADSLGSSARAGLQAAGFAIHSVALDELEKAGGSLRCMIGECY